MLVNAKCRNDLVSNVTVHCSPVLVLTNLTFQTTGFRVHATPATTGNTVFRVIFHHAETSSFHFWAYYDGLPRDAVNIIAEFTLMNEKNEPILMGRTKLVPLGVSVSQVCSNLEMVWVF